MDKEMMSMCGTYCEECEWRVQTNCQGCKKSQGKMFWGECQIAKCSIKKGHNHCGHCSVLPCEILQSAFDNPEHGDNGERLANLKSWAAGNYNYLSLKSKK